MVPLFRETIAGMRNEPFPNDGFKKGLDMGDAPTFVLVGNPVYFAYIFRNSIELANPAITVSRLVPDCSCLIQSAFPAESEGLPKNVR